MSVFEIIIDVFGIIVIYSMLLTPLILGFGYCISSRVHFGNRHGVSDNKEFLPTKSEEFISQFLELEDNLNSKVEENLSTLTDDEQQLVAKIQEVCNSKQAWKAKLRYKRHDGENYPKEEYRKLNSTYKDLLNKWGVFSNENEYVRSLNKITYHYYSCESKVGWAFFLEWCCIIIILFDLSSAFTQNAWIKAILILVPLIILFVLVLLMISNKNNYINMCREHKHKRFITFRTFALISWSTDFVDEMAKFSYIESVESDYGLNNIYHAMEVLGCRINAIERLQKREHLHRLYWWRFVAATAICYLLVRAYLILYNA